MRFIRICTRPSLLRSPRKKFLEDLVTGDKSRDLYDSNAHRTVWLPREELPSQAKSNMHLKTALLCCFWGSKGMLYSGTSLSFALPSSRNSRKLFGKRGRDELQCTLFMTMPDIVQLKRATKNRKAELGNCTPPATFS